MSEAGEILIEGIKLEPDCLVFDVSLGYLNRRNNGIVVGPSDCQFTYGEMSIRDLFDALDDCELKDFFDEIGPIPRDVARTCEFVIPNEAYDNIPDSRSFECKIPLSEFTVIKGLPEIESGIELGGVEE